MRHAVSLSLMAAMLTHLGCQEDVARPNFCPVDVPNCPVEVDQETIGPEGGSVSIEGAGELIIPPGALSAPSVVTLRTLAPEFLTRPAGTFNDPGQRQVQPTDELNPLAGMFIEIEPRDRELQRPALLILYREGREQNSPAVVGVVLDEIPNDPDGRKRWNRQSEVRTGWAPLGEVHEGEIRGLIDHFPPQGRAVGFAEPRLVPVDVYPTATDGLCAGLDFIEPAPEEASPSALEGWPEQCGEHPDDCAALHAVLATESRDIWLEGVLVQLSRSDDLGEAGTVEALRQDLVEALSFWWGLPRGSMDDPERFCSMLRPDPAAAWWKRATWCELRAFSADAVAPRESGAIADALDRWLIVLWLLDRAEMAVRLEAFARVLSMPAYPAKEPPRLADRLADRRTWLNWLTPAHGGAWSGRWAHSLPRSIARATAMAVSTRDDAAARFTEHQEASTMPRSVRCRVAALAAMPPDRAFVDGGWTQDPDADRARAELVAIARSAIRGAFVEIHGPRVEQLDALLRTVDREAGLVDAWRASVSVERTTAATTLGDRFCCVGGLDGDDVPPDIGPATVDCPAPQDLQPNEWTVPDEVPLGLGVSWLQPPCRFSETVRAFEVQSGPDTGTPLSESCAAVDRCTTWQISVPADSAGARRLWQPGEDAQSFWPPLDGSAHRWRVRARTPNSLANTWSRDARLLPSLTPEAVDVICADAAREQCDGDPDCTPVACAGERLARCDLPVPRAEDCPEGARCRLDRFGHARCWPDDEVVPPDDGLGHPAVGGGRDLDPDPRVVRVLCEPGSPIVSVVSGTIEPSVPGERCVRDETGITYCVSSVAGEPLAVGCLVERGAIIGLCSADGYVEVRARGAQAEPDGEPAADPDVPRALPPLASWAPAPLAPQAADCPPEPELCDGRDDDGDGVIDERTGGGPLLLGCAAQCRNRAIECIDGAFPPPLEACGCPPESDRCVDAGVLPEPGEMDVLDAPIRVVVIGNTRDAADDARPGGGCGAGDGADVFYRFDLEVLTRVVISSEGAGWLPRPWIRPAGCAGAAALCAEPGGGLDGELPAGAYELVVDGEGPGEGPFEVEMWMSPIGCHAGDPIVDDNGEPVPCEPPLEVGACRSGYLECAADGRGRRCVDRVEPTWPDDGDELDNDCDGTVDEDAVIEEDIGPPPPPPPVQPECEVLEDAGQCRVDCPCLGDAVCENGQCIVPVDPQRICPPGGICPVECRCDDGFVCDGGRCIEEVQCDGQTCGLVGRIYCPCPGNGVCIDNQCCEPSSVRACEGGSAIVTDGCGNELEREACPGGQCNAGVCDVVVLARPEELYYCNERHPYNDPYEIYTPGEDACDWQARPAEIWFGFYDLPSGRGFYTWGGDCGAPDYNRYVSHNARWHFTLTESGRYDILARVPANGEVCRVDQYSNYEYALFENNAGEGVPLVTQRFDQAAFQGDEGGVMSFDGLPGRDYTLVVYDQHPNGAGCIRCGEQRMVNGGDVQLYVSDVRIRRTGP